MIPPFVKFQIWFIWPVTHEAGNTLPQLKENPGYFCFSDFWYGRIGIQDWKKTERGCFFIFQSISVQLILWDSSLAWGETEWQVRRVFCVTEGWFCSNAVKPPLCNTLYDLTCCHSKRNEVKNLIPKMLLPGQQWSQNHFLVYFVLFFFYFIRFVR